MTTQQYNPTTELGRYNLKGQQKPKYLVDANENVEDAHTAYINLIDDEAAKDLIDHAWGKVVECELIARNAAVIWRQEICPHKATRTYHSGHYWTVEGDPMDNDIEDVTVCIQCHKVIG